MIFSLSSYLDAYFKFVSRLVIIIPILVVILAVAISHAKKNLSVAQRTDKTKIPTPSPFQNYESLDQIISSSGLKFGDTNSNIDLQGPWNCRYNSVSTKIQAMIKNQQIFSKIEKANQTNYYLFVKDCLYHWTADATEGKKTCGMGEIINLLSGLSQFGLFTSNSLFKYFLSEETPNLPDFGSICKKQPVADSFFQLPSAINFQDSQFDFSSFLPLMK